MSFRSYRQIPVEPQWGEPVPCYMCGGTPRLIRVILGEGTGSDYQEETHYDIECTRCLACAGPFDTPADAIKAWNQPYTISDAPWYLDLRPCPCGARPKLKLEKCSLDRLTHAPIPGEYVGLYCVVCPKCGVTGEGFDREEEAAKSWNEKVGGQR